LIPKPLDFFTEGGDLQLCSSIEENDGLLSSLEIELQDVNEYVEMKRFEFNKKFSGLN
jgi:hypothetical protein